MKNIFKILLVIALVLFTIYCVFYFRTILTYILLAGIFTLLGRPLMKVLRKIKVGKARLPKAFCAAITLLSFFLFIFGFIALFMPLILQEIRTITNIDLQTAIENLSKPLTKLDAYLAKLHLLDETRSSADIMFERIGSMLNMDNLSGIFGSFVGILGNLFAAIFSVSFITFFFLIDHDKIYRSIISLVPSKFERRFTNVVFTTEKLLTRYFIGVLIQISLIASLVTIGMLIFGIEHALLIGFFAGVINIIPYIGPVVGWVFGMFVGLTTNLDLEFYNFTLPVLVQISSVFATVQLLDNTFFQPLIFSSSIRAHPLEIFLLLWVAGTIAGIPGMILGIPCYTIVRVVGKELLSEFNLMKQPLRKVS